ncbi:unnamed protein product, partial [Closterium sp. NIES-54]
MDINRKGGCIGDRQLAPIDCMVSLLPLLSFFLILCVQSGAAVGVLQGERKPSSRAAGLLQPFLTPSLSLVPLSRVYPLPFTSPVRSCCWRATGRKKSKQQIREELLLACYREKEIQAAEQRAAAAAAAAAIAASVISVRGAAGRGVASRGVAARGVAVRGQARRGAQPMGTGGSSSSPSSIPAPSRHRQQQQREQQQSSSQVCVKVWVGVTFKGVGLQEKRVAAAEGAAAEQQFVVVVCAGVTFIGWASSKGNGSEGSGSKGSGSEGSGSKGNGSEGSGSEGSGSEGSGSKGVGREGAGEARGSAYGDKSLPTLFHHRKSERIKQK